MEDHNDYQPKREKVYRAGMIPYHVNSEGVIEMMFMRPRDGRFGEDCFQVAKGRQEGDEQFIKTAIREAEEELGLKMSNVEFVEHVGNFLGRTNVYICKVKDPADFNEFDKNETSAVSWMTYDEFFEDGRKLHRTIVKPSYALMLQMEDMEGLEEEGE